MIDQKIDEKEAQDLGKIYNLYLEKRNDLMKQTRFKFADVFGDILGKDTISPEQITKLINSLRKKL